MAKGKNKGNRKTGFNLITKLMAIVIVSLVALMIFAGLAIRAAGTKTASKMVAHELNLALYSLNQTFDAISLQDFVYEDDCLYKGQTNLTKYPLVLDNFKTNTGVEIAIFWGDVSVASSITDADGNRVLGMKAPEKAYAEVMGGEGELYYSSDELINGQKYYGVYKPICLSGESTPVGMIFAGITKELASNEINAYLTGSLLFMSILVIVIGVVMAVYIYILVKSITGVVESLNKVSGGELDVTVDDKLLKRPDEVGDIARSVESLVLSFSEIVNSIRQTSDSLNRFSVQFLENFQRIEESISTTDVAVEEIAKGAVCQAEETLKVSGQIDEISKAIDRSSKNTEVLAVSAGNMKKQKEQVDSTLNELVEISSHTRKSIDEIQCKTNETNQSVMEIRSATDFISDIASQTNLLSLNASIEAARAGEAGRGFAVVADEIRSLADQSNVSAEKIKKIVDTLISNSDSSVATMKLVTEEISHQNEKLDLTRTVFEKLNDEVNHVNEVIDSISGDVRVLDVHKDNVGDAIDSLASISEENEAGTKETAAFMIKLTDIVNECREAAAQFVKLSDDLTNHTNRFRL